MRQSERPEKARRSERPEKVRRSGRHKKVPDKFGVYDNKTRIERTVAACSELIEGKFGTRGSGRAARAHRVSEDDISRCLKSPRYAPYFATLKKTSMSLDKKKTKTKKKKSYFN